MERNNLSELLTVLEAIRRESFPDIPANVVADIVSAQAENLAERDRVRARTQSQSIIMKYLNESAPKD